VCVLLAASLQQEPTIEPPKLFFYSFGEKLQEIVIDFINKNITNITCKPGQKACKLLNKGHTKTAEFMLTSQYLINC
jgi:hypothetical protein